MLRTNLSTRPFYNERAVRAALAAVGALAVGLALFNAFEIVRLRGQSRDARESVTLNDAQARDLREKAQVIRRSIDKEKLAVVQAAAHEANALIDRRTFSWTELLNHFQATLPPDVRIGGVTPQQDAEGRRLVQVSVFSKRVEDVEQFMDALEKTGAFSGVLPRSEQPDEDGLCVRGTNQRKLGRVQLEPALVENDRSLGVRLGGSAGRYPRRCGCSRR